MDWLISLAPVFGAGILAGLTVAMPFGPFGQLAARLTTEKKRRDARELAYAAVAVDAMISAVVLYFLHVVPNNLSFAHPFVQGGIGIALLAIGAELWYSANAHAPGKLPCGFKRPWHFAVVYSLLHPGSALVFITAFGVFVGEGAFVGTATPMLAKTLCWLGVVCGMFLMWVMWLSLIHHLKRRMSHNTLRLVFARGLALTLALSGGVLVYNSGLVQTWLG
jgi:threonine/homoserine/homoserine lactone efflux protein